MPEVPGDDAGMSASAHDPDVVEKLRRQVEHLQRAIDSHERIGIATGLVAHRLGCSPEQAWQVLVHLSQCSNLKVRVLADLLIDSHADRLDPSDQLLAWEVERMLDRATLG